MSIEWIIIYRRVIIRFIYIYINYILRMTHMTQHEKKYKTKSRLILTKVHVRDLEKE